MQTDTNLYPTSGKKFGGDNYLNGKLYGGDTFLSGNKYNTNGEFISKDSLDQYQHSQSII